MYRPLHRTVLALAAAATLTLAGCAAEEAPPAGDGAETAEGSMSDDMADEDMADGMTDEPTEEEMAEDTAEDMADEMLPAVYEFSATTLDGGTFDGGTLAGSPAVLWFWAPWCPICIGQIPTVTDLAETYGDDVTVVGVGGLDDAEAISAMAENDIPHVTHLVDDGGEVWQHFDITQQSTFVVLDADGEVVADGTVPESELESLVADLAS